MKTSAIIQARMGSTRLPGKVMKKILGYPLIELIVKRLKKSKLLDEVIVATSNNKENYPLINFLQKKKIKYCCGSENDVLARYYSTATKNKINTIVRITGDCPLVDPKIVDEFVSKFKKTNVDYLSNCNPWTYPDGLDVEVFSYKILKRAHQKAKKKHRQNGGVLISFLRDNKKFKILNIKNPIKNSLKLRLTVDEEVDFKLISNIYNHFKPNIFFDHKKIVSYAKKINQFSF
jgi:glutamate-1-semialdehyde 2,1-aminomutase